MINTSTIKELFENNELHYVFRKDELSDPKEELNNLKKIISEIRTIYSSTRFPEIYERVCELNKKLDNIKFDYNQQIIDVNNKYFIENEDLTTDKALKKGNYYSNLIFDEKKLKNEIDKSIKDYYNKNHKNPEDEDDIGFVLMQEMFINEYDNIFASLFELRSDFISVTFSKQNNNVEVKIKEKFSFFEFLKKIPSMLKEQINKAYEVVHTRVDKDYRKTKTDNIKIYKEELYQKVTKLFESIKNVGIKDNTTINSFVNNYFSFIDEELNKIITAVKEMESCLSTSGTDIDKAIPHFSETITNKFILIEKELCKELSLEIN